jgi:hypothetical protein
MDGRGGLNLLYAETYDAIGLLWAVMRPSGAPFHRVIPGFQAIPLKQVDLKKRSTEGTMPPDMSYDTLVMKMELH